MTIPKFSAERSGAIRGGLVGRVASTRRSILQKPWAGVAAFALAGALVGGAVSGAAALSAGGNQPGRDSSTSSDGHGVPAPAGVLPGAPIISILGTSSAITVDTTTAVDLGEAPDGATHVRVSVSCLSVGQISYGFDGSGNNPKGSCSQADLDSPNATTGWFDFALGGGSVLYLGLSDGMSAIVTTQFLNYVDTAWGVNARGETFGVAKTGGITPDLLAVVGSAPDGNLITGYAYTLDIDGGPLPRNPDEAAHWVPRSHDVAVYESDGETVIGTFHVG